MEESLNMKITILGCGAWGTANAIVLHDNGYKVTLWSKFESEAEILHNTRKNPLLEGILLPVDINITTDLTEATTDVGVIIVAVPSFAIRETAEALKGKIKKGCIIVCMSKGIEKDTSSLFTSILENILATEAQIASVSGPTHAEEVARRIPSACVAASEDIKVAERVQSILMNDYLRVYTSTDVIGAELGAALKNVIALSVGICKGLGFGDNTVAMLMTRGLAEIAELCVKMGGRKETLAGLTGVGDLIVTCMSDLSRNRRVGVLIGQGMPTATAMQNIGAVAEGYYAASAVRKLAAQIDVDMPICNEVYRVLYEDKSPMLSMRELMDRRRKSELPTGQEAWVT
jgi:glycerol-3-phosphate dehydrogenase (NAD(P)+)